MISEKKIKNLFKKAGHFYVIRWTEEAKESFVGGDLNKEIALVYNGYVVETEPYDEVKEDFLRRRGEIVIDKTEGEELPKESIFIPETIEVLSNIQVRRRLG